MPLEIRELRDLPNMTSFQAGIAFAAEELIHDSFTIDDTMRERIQITLSGSLGKAMMEWIKENKPGELQWEIDRAIHAIAMKLYGEKESKREIQELYDGQLEDCIHGVPSDVHCRQCRP